MICGIGVDLVDIARFERQLKRTPVLRDRLFTEGERDLPIRSLAARFAAKEALIKALGGSDGVSWQDLEIVRGEGQAPRFTRTIGLSGVLAARGMGQPWVSIAHDAGLAVATVVLETDGEGRAAASAALAESGMSAVAQTMGTNDELSEGER